MTATTSAGLKLPLTLVDSAPWSPTLRFERRTIIDNAGDALAFVDYSTHPDPEGISGEAAHVIRLRTAAGFRAWESLCDAIGARENASGRALGELEVRGADGIATLLDSLRALT